MKTTWKIINWHLERGSFDIRVSDGTTFRVWVPDDYWDQMESMQSECADACTEAGLPMWRWDEYERKDVLDEEPYSEDSYFNWGDGDPPTEEDPISFMPIWVKVEWYRHKEFFLRKKLRSLQNAVG